MLNLKNVHEEFITKANLLKHVNEYDIYAYYLGVFDTYSIMSSPFREDKSPSFGIYIGTRGNLMYNDFKLGSGDCIKFVSIMENCTYSQALGILNVRYNLGYQMSKYHKANSIYTKPPVLYNKEVIPKEDVWIDIKIRDWDIRDKEYWSQYEITLDTLTYFDVYPIKRFWINDKVFNVQPLAYAYYYNDRVFKIYQPQLDVKSGKWFSNIKNKEEYQGSNQLPDSGEILFITSSLKDVMVLYEAGYSAIAPHTEHQILSEGLFSYYQSKWDLMTVFYDNDEAGQLHANKMVNKYGIKSIQLPEEDTKDPSDFVQKYDLNSLKEWICQNI